MNNQHPLIQAASNNDILEVARLTPLTMEHIRDDALLIAAQEGHVECLKLLIPSNLSSKRSLALLMAVQNNRVECVRILAPHFPLLSLWGIKNSLQEAADFGHAECVRILAPMCSDMGNALELATRKGCIDCVQALLDSPHCDPKHKNSIALQKALYHGRDEIFELLYEASDPYDAIEHMFPTALKPELIAKLQQRILSDNIDTKQTSRGLKKI